MPAGARPCQGIQSDSALCIVHKSGECVDYAHGAFFAERQQCPGSAVPTVHVNNCCGDFVPVDEVWVAPCSRTVTGATLRSRSRKVIDWPERLR